MNASSLDRWIMNYGGGSDILKMNISSFRKDTKKIRPDLLHNNYNTENWLKGKEIRVFSKKGIKTQVKKTFINGVKKFLKNYSLDFKIIDCGEYESFPGLEYKGKLVDVDTTMANLAYENYRKYNPHGDIIFVDKPFYKRQDDWGESLYATGAILVYPHNQSSLKLLEKLGVHEAFHLFGYQTHCKYSKDCVMNWSLPSARACDRCDIAIRLLHVRIYGKLLNDKEKAIKLYKELMNEYKEYNILKEIYNKAIKTHKFDIDIICAQLLKEQEINDITSYMQTEILKNR